MTDTENTCTYDALTEKVADSLSCECPERLPETIKALTELVKAICSCDCTDPVDPVDPVDPDIGEEELLETYMTSNDGNDEFTPIASSVYPISGYSMWAPFYNRAASAGECWVSHDQATVTPQYIGVIMKTTRYIITKIEFTNKIGGTIAAPKEFVLQYRDAEGNWHDLTERQTNTMSDSGGVYTVAVPAEKQIVCTGVRLQAYSSYGGGTTGQIVVVARMRIYGKKVS